ncbi:MAG: hypothetical protein JRG86_10045 [Deltaproteobacteria bacterium]|jgi:hypothetical protein|nr:hypothetical protein [Deltaproteobacteria bacterium]MBW2500018.1 hypothetical protein [Deltaproteobacteria bacterium]
MKRLCVVFAVAVVLTMPMTAMSAERSEPAFATKVVDVALVRPLAMVGSIVTSAIAVGISPITWMTGTGDASVDYLVSAPWRFTAHRYPGEFAEYKDRRSATGRVLQR